MTTNQEPLITLACHLETKRPGCVNIQAILGNGRSNFFLQQTFDCKHWMVTGVDEMRNVQGTKEQWERHSKMLEMRD